jgi:DNA primase
MTKTSNDLVFFEKLVNACHDLLPTSKKAHDYLIQRGITEATINEYKLGFFPTRLKNLYNYVHPEELREKGIITNASESPFTNNNLVIPIKDATGRPIAIGGRSLLGDVERKELGIPKYRNSSFNKGSYLFGLDKAKDAIRGANRAFVVEGYFDCISAHQRGHKNVVAGLGTAFTYRQLLILSRYTDNICILFDNDEAGKYNAKRVLDQFAETGLAKLSCAFTPDGYKDLDEYLTRGGTWDYFI